MKTLISLLFLPSLLLAQTPSANLLQNPGFEDSRAKKTLPVDWAFTKGGTTGFQYITGGRTGETVVGGSASICLFKGGGPDEGCFVIDNALPSVKAGATYQLTVRARGVELDEDDLVRVAVTWIDASKKKLESHAESFHPGSGFQDFSVSWTAPDGAAYVRPMVGILPGKNSTFPASGKVYVDDVEFSLK